MRSESCYIKNKVGYHLKYYNKNDKYKNVCLNEYFIMCNNNMIIFFQNKLKLLKIYLYYTVMMSFFIIFFRMFDVGLVWTVEVPIVIVYIGKTENFY